MTPEIDNVGAAIIKGVCNPKAEDIAVELGEFALDSFLDEHVLKEIPVIKTVIAYHKTWAAIQDQLFLRKVASFLLACPKFAEAEKEDFLIKHLNDPKNTKALGSAVVLILDKFDDFEKPAMLAKIFAAHMRGHINYADFRRLAGAVNSAFVGDLKNILSLPANPREHPEQLLKLLLPSGLAREGGGVSKSFSIGTQVFLSELGRLFQKCMSEE
jgi:hypothetical protein